MLAIALALSSSLAWGLADFLGGLQARRLSTLLVLALSQLAGLIGLGVLIAALGRPAPALALLWPAAVGGLIGAVGLGAFYRALAVGTMSVVAPVAATGVAIPVLAGLLGGDDPSGLEILGILLAVAGVLLVTQESGGDAAARRAGRRGTGLALVAAACFGVFFLTLAESSEADPLWATLAARSSSVCLLALAVVAWRGRVGSPPRAALPTLALVGLLDVTANATFAVASTLGLLSVVSVLSALYPAVTVALAALVLGERLRQVQRAGVVSALAGTIALAAG